MSGSVAEIERSSTELKRLYKELDVLEGAYDERKRKNEELASLNDEASSEMKKVSEFIDPESKSHGQACRHRFLRYMHSRLPRELRDAVYDYLVPKGDLFVVIDLTEQITWQMKGASKWEFDPPYQFYQDYLGPIVAAELIERLYKNANFTLHGMIDMAEFFQKDVLRSWKTHVPASDAQPARSINHLRLQIVLDDYGQQPYSPRASWERNMIPTPGDLCRYLRKCLDILSTLRNTKSLILIQFETRTYVNPIELIVMLLREIHPAWTEMRRLGFKCLSLWHSQIRKGHCLHRHSPPDRYSHCHSRSHILSEILDQPQEDIETLVYKKYRERSYDRLQIGHLHFKYAKSMCE